MTDNHPDEQRQFNRIPFDATAHLYDLTGKFLAKCSVIDISLKGILITKPEGWQGHISAVYQLDLMLRPSQAVIKMTATVAHIDPQRIGFLCEYSDLDSLSHLKRLVELNLADETSLQREFSALLH